MLLPRRLDVNVQAEQAKDAEAPFANVDGGSGGDFRRLELSPFHHPATLCELSTAYLSPSQPLRMLAGAVAPACRWAVQ
ncbi:MAG: hypothetical protein DRI52_07320, partial [Chloroflexi bacterium]